MCQVPMVHCRLTASGNAVVKENIYSEMEKQILELIESRRRTQSGCNLSATVDSIAMSSEMHASIHVPRSHQRFADPSRHPADPDNGFMNALTNSSAADLRKSHNPAQLRQLMRSTAPINGITPLVVAAYQCDVEKIRLVKEYGDELDSRVNALVMAARKNSEEAVSELLLDETDEVVLAAFADAVVCGSSISVQQTLLSHIFSHSGLPFRMDALVCMLAHCRAELLEQVKSGCYINESQIRAAEAENVLPYVGTADEKLSVRERIVVAATANTHQASEMLEFLESQVHVRYQYQSPTDLALQMAVFKGDHAALEFLVQRHVPRSALTHLLGTMLYSLDGTISEDHLACVELLVRKCDNRNFEYSMEPAAKRKAMTAIDICFSKADISNWRVLYDVLRSFGATRSVVDADSQFDADAGAIDSSAPSTPAPKRPRRCYVIPTVEARAASRILRAMEKSTDGGAAATEESAGLRASIRPRDSIRSRPP